MKFSQTIQRVILLAKDMQVEDAERMPEGELVGDTGFRIVRGSDPAFRNPAPHIAREGLKAYLSAQSIATIYTLTMLMYVGRGDEPASGFMDQYEDTCKSFESPKWAVNQMMGKVVLADYLETAVKLLEEAKIDLDKLMDS
jgi:hypothetical protein